MAAVALLVLWPKGPQGTPGAPATMGRMASSRATRVETIGGGARGWSAAVLPVQAEPPADQVTLDLGEEARLEVRGRAVVGVERGAADEGIANRVILQEGTVAYRRPAGANAARTLLATPQGTVSLRGGRAVLAVAAEGTRLHVLEGEAVISGRDEGRETTVTARQTATISGAGQVALGALPAALFVSGPRKADVPSRYLDSLIVRRLETRGFAVDEVDELELRTDHLAGHALVVISPSVSSALRNRAQELDLQSANVPILCSAPSLFAELGLTGPGRANAEFSERKRHVAIADQAHPLAAGLHGDVEVLGATMPLGWGIPGAGAARVAVFRDRSERAAIFAYDRNTPLVAPAGRAAGRRVGFFLHPTGARFLNARAWSLFDAAVKWAAADAP
jgi:hypothetical protein